jgi:uncharacterized membrane protein
MSTVEQSIELEVPVRVAYDQWTQFESFPKFMEGVDEVRQLDDTHTRWRTTVAGRQEEFDAEITEQHPDERVAWHATSGPSHAGVVTFHRLSDTRSKIMLQLDVEPEGVVEKVGAALGVLGHRTKGDLERFKTLVESRQDATGDYRDEASVDDGMPKPPPGAVAAPPNAHLDGDAGAGPIT